MRRVRGASPEERADILARRLADYEVWAREPVRFVQDVLRTQPDPWQADALDALMEEPRVGVRSSHGAGKTALLSWATIWFTTCRTFSKVPTTAPTFNKQVRDVLWADIYHYWRLAQQAGGAAWLTEEFEITSTRFQHVEHRNEWFAVGIASKEAINLEGYKAPHILVIFDEAKGIPRAVWEAVVGMQTTLDAKMLVASTPGGPTGEFYKLFTAHRQTWKTLFVVHPASLRDTLRRPAAPPYSRGGTYYSERVPASWVEMCRQEWGEDSPVFVARTVGDFPSVEGDVLIPYSWLSDAEDREDGIPGPCVVGCDVARYGRDRTVLLGGRGGTLEYGESLARTPAESISPTELEIGPDPKRPRYRSVPATADACRRVRQLIGAETIAIDDDGVGGGPADILAKKGERVVPIAFGASPTDRPKTPEERARRQAKHMLDTRFVNLKAEMAWKLREAFEQGLIALGRLPKGIKDALVAQTSMVRYEMNSAGQIKIIDPDEQDPYAQAAGNIEGRKSPDHFHALLLYWWVAGSLERRVKPMAGQPGALAAQAQAGRIPPGIGRVGEGPGPMARSGAGITPAGRGAAATWVQRTTGRYGRW
jgi:hypothetical protein